jgi:hypothetical protein
MNELTPYGKSIIDDLVDAVRRNYTVEEKYELYDNLGVQLLDEGLTRSVFINKNDTKNAVLKHDSVIKIDQHKGNINNKLEIMNYKKFPTKIKKHFMPILSYDDQHGSWLIMPRSHGNPSNKHMKYINYKLFCSGISDIARVGFERGPEYKSMSMEISKRNCGIHNGEVVIYDYAMVFYKRIKYDAVVEYPMKEWKKCCQ